MQQMHTYPFSNQLTTIYSQGRQNLSIEMEFLLESKEKNLPFSVKGVYRDLNFILFDQKKNAYELRPIILNALKTVAIIASYIASYPFIKPAEEITDQFILKKCFAVGEFAAWGTLSAWSACRLINQIITKRQFRRPLSKSLLYWVPLFSLGIISEIPSSYISYHYNQSIFWALYTPLIYSLFSIQSMDALIQQIANSNNLLTNYLYKHTTKNSVFKSKENFINILEYCLAEFLKEASPLEKQQILTLSSSTILDSFDRSTIILFKILQTSLERKMQDVSNQPLYIKKGNQLVQILGAVTSLTMSGMDGYLVYKGGKLLFDSKILIALIIILAVVPSAYLSANINCNNYKSIFNSLINMEFKKKFFTRIPNRVGYTMAIVATCFGLGSLTTVLKDNLDLEKRWALLIFVVVIIASGILTINAISEFSDLGVEKWYYLRSTQKEKEFKKINYQIEELIEYFNTMPIEIFGKFLETIKISKLESENLNILLEKTQESPEIRAIIESIDTNIFSSIFNQQSNPLENTSLRQSQTSIKIESYSIKTQAQIEEIEEIDDLQQNESIAKLKIHKDKPFNPIQQIQNMLKHIPKTRV